MYVVIGDVLAGFLVGVLVDRVGRWVIVVVASLVCLLLFGMLAFWFVCCLV